jgi:hypothetical protein
MLTAVESSQHNSNGVNHSSRTGSSLAKSQKQRVTITLPVALLERLRNAVYWTGHGPLARLIADALDDAVTQMETSNGQPFPARLAPLKRGRPRTKPRSSIPIDNVQSV